MKNAADLYWLAYLLTGREDISIDIATDAASKDEANSFFGDWMRGWSRRIVIAKALDVIRPELAESRRRTEQARIHRKAAVPKDSSLSHDAARSQIEEALLSIDVFPRAAVILSVFEGVHTADAATLLDANADLVKKGQAIGLGELTANLAGRKQPRAGGFFPAAVLA